jgi:hypothetical protein
MEASALVAVESKVLSWSTEAADVAGGASGNAFTDVLTAARRTASVLIKYIAPNIKSFPV